MSDADLLVRARDGDPLAFEAFVRNNERRVRAVIVHLLDDLRDVDECVQDTFVQVWRHLSSFRADASPATWVHRIAVNVALQRRRRSILSTTSLETLPEPELSRVRLPTQPDVAVEHRELNRAIAASVRGLPFTYRAPLVLRDVVGMSTEEVAHTLELSIAAVKSRVRRARLQLCAELEGWQRSSM